MNTNDTQPAIDEKPEAITKGLGSFKRKAPDPKAVSSEVGASLEYFQSFVKTGSGEKKDSDSEKAPSSNPSGTTPTRKPEKTPKITPVVVREEQSSKTASKKSRADFSQDGTAFTFRWESRLQADWETLQLEWKKSGLRTTSREFLIVAATKALKMTKDEYQAALGESLEKYGAD